MKRSGELWVRGPDLGVSPRGYCPSRFCCWYFTSTPFQKLLPWFTIERELCAVPFATSDPFSVVLDDVIPLHVRVESEPVFLYEPYLLFDEHFELVVSSAQTHSLLFFAVTDVQNRCLRCRRLLPSLHNALRDPCP